MNMEIGHALGVTLFIFHIPLSMSFTVSVTLLLRIVVLFFFYELYHLVLHWFCCCFMSCTRVGLLGYVSLRRIHTLLELEFADRQ